MKDMIIADDIYKDSMSLTESSYRISDDLYEEARSLDKDTLSAEIYSSYKVSGRYWIWRMGAYAYRNFWTGMVDDGEMRIDAPGLRYFSMYLTVEKLASAYELLHPDRQGIFSNPPAYYAFAHSLRRGDVVIVSSLNKVIGWGIVEGEYMYRPTRTFGCHYRKVSWNMVDMPFIFTYKRPAIYRVPDEETHKLKETLIGKTIGRSTSVSLFGA